LKNLKKLDPGCKEDLRKRLCEVFMKEKKEIMVGEFL